jgi:hypothetical protein
VHAELLLVGRQRLKPGRRRRSAWRAQEVKLEGLKRAGLQK